MNQYTKRGWSSQYCSIFQIKTQDKQKHSYIINKDIIKLEIKNIIAYENVLIKNVNVIIIEVVSKDQYTHNNLTMQNILVSYELK